MGYKVQYYNHPASKATEDGKYEPKHGDGGYWQDAPPSFETEEEAIEYIVGDGINHWIMKSHRVICDCCDTEEDLSVYWTSWENYGSIVPTEVVTLEELEVGDVFSWPESEPDPEWTRKTVSRIDGNQLYVKGHEWFLYRTTETCTLHSKGEQAGGADEQVVVDYDEVEIGDVVATQRGMRKVVVERGPHKGAGEDLLIVIPEGAEDSGKWVSERGGNRSYLDRGNYKDGVTVYRSEDPDLVDPDGPREGETLAEFLQRKADSAALAE